jgi:DNA-binding CsgD family transcriptional regulator/GAF domain-containing protein
VSASDAAASVSPARAERRLLPRVQQLVRNATELLGEDFPAPGDALSPLSHAGSILSQVTWTALGRLEHLEDGDEKAPPLTTLALRANDLEDEVRRHIYAARMNRQTQIESGLAQLRRLRTSAELLDRVCDEIVSSCGFVRSMLSRVDGDVWIPWMVHFKGDPESGHEFLDWMRNRELTLDDLTLERTLVAEKRAEMVVNTAVDPRVDPQLAAAGRLRSYVVAPIIPAGRVVGFLHADHGLTGREVTEEDRDILWAFAEGFGRLYERVVLQERIHAQHRLVADTFEIAEGITMSLARAEIELEHEGVERATAGDLLGETLAPDAAIDELLTAREKQVLSMMVRGMSNKAIAEQLVIQVGTVKSHAKHVLRKLGAVNRAAAISKYLGVAGDD